MYFILGIIIITGVLLTIKSKNSDDSWFISAILSFMSAVIVILAIVALYQEKADFSEVVAARQETINEIIGDKEDKVSNREKAELVKTILETNEKIKLLQLDNAGWLWSLETPDLVDTIEPIKMVCTCPK